MQALTENQRNFVFAYVELGGQEAERAAAAAGYGGTPGSLAVASHRLMHNPKVLAAIKEVADERLRTGALLGASVLIEIAQNSLHKDRFKAAVELLNRAGLMVVTEHKVTVEHKDPTTLATIARIRALAAGMGMDAKPLLLSAGVPQHIIDAEFEVIAPAQSAAGLEDLL
jgi:phage terminase small subunit